MAKKYRLLKDLPFAKAGAIFKEWTGERSGKEEKVLVNTNNLTTTLWAGDIEAFDEWFEEVKELELPKEFFYVLINKITSVNYLTYSFDEETRQEYRNIVEKHKSVDNYFETKEEAEKYLAYLKAKAIIKQDTKGFAPDWDTNKEPKYIEPKYIGSYGGLPEKPTLNWNVIYTYTYSTICFRTLEDIMDSFKKHPEEWRIYLTYGQ